MNKLKPFNAKRLKELRERQKLSQAQLAERAGVSQGLIWQLEHGLKQPGLATLVRIAEALGASPSEFVPAKGKGLEVRG